jgi:hypothetical protein
MARNSLTFIMAVLLLFATFSSMAVVRDEFRGREVRWRLGEVNGGIFYGGTDYDNFWEAKSMADEDDEYEVLTKDGYDVSTYVDRNKAAVAIVYGAWIFPSAEVFETLRAPKRVRAELSVNLDNERADGEEIESMVVEVEIKGPRDLHDFRSFNLTESGRISFYFEPEGFGEYLANISCRLTANGGNSQPGEASAYMEIVKGLDLKREKFNRKGYDSAVNKANEFRGVHSIEIFFNWMKENFKFESDGPFEVIHSPDNLLKRGADDCDGFAVLTACILQEGLGYDTAIYSTDVDGDGVMDHAFAVVRCSKSYFDYMADRYKEEIFRSLPSYYDDSGYLFIVDAAYGTYPGSGEDEWHIYNAYEWYEMVGLRT